LKIEPNDTFYGACFTGWMPLCRLTNSGKALNGVADFYILNSDM